MALSRAELIDLETRLQRDRALTEGELQARDEALCGRIGAKGADDSLLRAWLDELYAGQDRPGPRLLAKLPFLTTAAVFAGLFLGGATSAAVFHSDRTQPIDVGHAFGLLVATQLLLLLALLVGLVWKRAQTLLMPAWILVEHLLLRYAGLNTRFATPVGKVLLWRAVSLLQTFAVAFNLAALAVLLMLASFTDLAFSWSTTLVLSPDVVKAWTDALSAPWFWWPIGRPTMELVVASQFYRTGGAFDAIFSGAWWPFLAGCLVAYGLLPRVVLLAVARWQERRALGRMDLGTSEVRALLRRLTEVPARVGEKAAGARAVESANLVNVVLWRDLPVEDAAARALVEGLVGGRVASVGKAGGTAGDLDGGEAARSNRADHATVILLDVFENLDKALLRFITGLRRELGPEHLIILAPTAADGAAPRPADDAAKLAVWRASVSRAGDRRLALAEGKPA